MGSVACKITMDTTGGINAWFVRFYDKVSDIRDDRLSDCYECHWIEVCAETMEYLDDKMLLETLKKRKEADDDSAKI